MQGSIGRVPYGLAPLAGALVTLMYGINSRLFLKTGAIAASLSIHLAGLAAVSLLALTRREPQPQRRPPFFHYLGGAIGVGTVFTSNYAFSVLDASLAVALGLLGQALFSLVADATGFLGRPRRPLTLRRLPGLGLAALGVLVLAGSWKGLGPAALAALLSGILPGLSLLLNAELGRSIGLFRSARWNYLAGLGTTLALALALRLPLAGATRSVLAAGPFLALGGGLLGAAVVASTNYVAARLSAFASTLLLFSGQAITGVLVDLAAAGRLDRGKLLGTGLLLAGLVLDGFLGRSRRVKAVQERALLRTGPGACEAPRIVEGREAR